MATSYLTEMQWQDWLLFCLELCKQTNILLDEERECKESSNLYVYL